VTNIPLPPPMRATWSNSLASEKGVRPTEWSRIYEAELTFVREFRYGPFHSEGIPFLGRKAL